MSCSAIDAPALAPAEAAAAGYMLTAMGVIRMGMRGDSAFPILAPIVQDAA